ARRAGDRHGEAARGAGAQRDGGDGGGGHVHHARVHAVVCRAARRARARHRTAARARGFVVAAGKAVTDADADALLLELREDPAALAREWKQLSAEPFPGRSEALIKTARALNRRLPDVEYVLPEHTIEWLLERARKIHGRKVPLRGAAGHKGRVGDGVERLLV